MKKVLVWFLLIGILGTATIGTTQMIDPTPQILADDPKVGGGAGG